MASTDEKRKRRKVIAAGVTGNLLEWYDFAVYGFYAPIIATWLIARTHDDLSIAWYLIACAVVSFLVVPTLKETAGKPLPD